MILGYFFSSRKYWECKSLKLINIRIVHTIKLRLHLPLATKLFIAKRLQRLQYVRSTGKLNPFTKHQMKKVKGQWLE